LSGFDAILPVILLIRHVHCASNGQQVKRQDAIARQEHIKPDAYGVGLDAFHGNPRALIPGDQHTSSARQPALFVV
jgi:hypothetical protein